MKTQQNHDKTYLRGVQPRKTETCLHSYRDQLKSWNFTVSIVTMWAPSSEFVSSSIPSWQILTAHAQPFRGATDLAFCLKVPLDSLLVWASSGGFDETARMRRLAWTFAACIGDKYQIRLTRPMLSGQRTIKALFRLHVCLGWSASLLFVYGIRQVLSCCGLQILMCLCSSMNINFLP